MRPLWKYPSPPLSWLESLVNGSYRLMVWLCSVLRDWRNWIIFGIVYLSATSPTWVGWLMYLITRNAWHLTYSTAYMAFWALPLTPLIPLCVAVTVGIRKFFRGNSRLKKRN